MARGWYGNKEAHSRAAKKGWRNRKELKTLKKGIEDLERRAAAAEAKADSYLQKKQYTAYRRAQTEATGLAGQAYRDRERIQHLEVETKRTAKERAAEKRAAIKRTRDAMKKIEAEMKAGRIKVNAGYRMGR